MTYVKCKDGFMYLFLITDAYSKRILGYNLSLSTQAKDALKALRMALKARPRDEKTKLVHHSDRGIQYCSQVYTKMLNKNGIEISMTQNSDPLDNNIAERMNGIIKGEWLKAYKGLTTSQMTSRIHKIIHIYNNKRPHLSNDMLTPKEAHQMEGVLAKRWKNYKRIKRKEPISLRELLTN